MRKKHTGLKVAGVILALIAGMYFLFAFKETVYTGNSYVNDSDLNKALMQSPYDKNTLLFYIHYKLDPAPLPKGVEDVKIKFEKPWCINIHVTEEKAVAQAYDVDGQYAVFGETGRILYLTTEKAQNVPVIEGLSVTSDPEVGKKVISRDDRFFEKITDLVRGLEEAKLKPDSIRYKKDVFEMDFNDIHVKMGHSYYAEKVEMLPGILEKLKGRSGNLDLSEHAPKPRYVSFRPDSSEEEEKGETEEEMETEDIVSSQ